MKNEIDVPREKSMQVMCLGEIKPMTPALQDHCAEHLNMIAPVHSVDVNTLISVSWTGSYVNLVFIILHSREIV